VAKKRITKKNLKEDEFIESIASFKEKYEQNKKTINTVGTILLILIVGFLFIRHQKQTREAKAIEALGQVEVMYYQNNLDQTIALGEEMLRKYNGTKQAGYCNIIVGNCYYNKGEYGKALNYYQQYIKDYNDVIIYKYGAYDGIGNCFAQQGKYLDAAKAYLEGAKALKNTYGEPFLIEKAADSYSKAGKIKEALDNYKKIIDTFEDYPKLDIVKLSYYELNLSK